MATAKVGRGRTGCMQGRFIPKNPSKYVGDSTRIIFRSSWELHFMKWIDANDAVVQWFSEEIAIPYVHPFKTDSAGRPKIARYFPDFGLRYKDASGTIKTELIEIKPYSQTVLTPKTSDRDKQEYVVNQAKWKAAAAFTARNGSSFRVVTERALFMKKAPKKKPNMSEPAPVA